MQNFPQIVFLQELLSQHLLLSYKQPVFLMNIQAPLPIHNLYTSLQILRTYCQTPAFHRIFLICGNQFSGKTTLIHYLMGKKLSPDISDDGQQVLSIMEPATKQVVLDDILQLYPHQESKTLYIRLNGFLNEEMTNNQQLQWAVTFQYMSSLLIKLQKKVGFLLVFSLFEEDLPFLINNFRKNFSIYENFQQRTAFILSKLGDESDMDEFTSMTAIDMIEADQNLIFVKEIMNTSNILPFCSKDPEQEDRESIKKNLENLFLKEKLKYSNQNLQKYLRISLKTWVQQNNLPLTLIVSQAKIKLKLSMELLNSYACLTLFQISGQRPNQTFINMLTQNLRKFGSKNEVNFDNWPVNNHGVKSLFKLYENLRANIRENKKKFIQELLENIKVVSDFWGGDVKNQSFLEAIEIGWILCHNFDNEEFQLEIIEIFQSPTASFLSDLVLSNIFQKVKEHFSASFVKENSENMKSPKKVTNKKKIVTKKPKFEELQIQKRKTTNFSIQRIMELPISPLKIDLLLTQLKKKVQMKKPDFPIFQIKVLVRKITAILEMYEEYQGAIKLFLATQDFISIEKILFLYCQKIKADSKQKVSKPQLDFIEMVIKYFYARKRQKNFDLSEANTVLLTERYSTPEKQEKFQKELRQIQILKAEAQFMNFKKAQQVFKDQNNIVERCVNYEEKNWDKFQNQLVLLHGLFKKIND